MVKCDGCWLFYNGEEADCNAGGKIECRPLWEVGTYSNAWVYFSNNCPLLEIKLKDGTIFKPEVIND
jgi:hypothetical protein